MYCNVCNKYRKLKKKKKKLYILQVFLMLTGSVVMNMKKYWKGEEESIEILKVFALIINIEEH